MTGVEQGGTAIATYVYDALNRRIGADDNGTETWTVYNGTNPYADFNGSGSLEVRYQHGPGVVNGAIVDQLLARTSSGGTTAWYLPDKLGSVRDIVSTSGTELDHIVYDSFGNIVTETNAANGDRFKYAGMQFDPIISQYYDNARWYAPGVGRFVGLDPKGFAAGDVDLYRYLGNGPSDGVDPSGLSISQSAGDYFHYLFNPGDMDQDLQTAHNVAMTTLSTASTASTLLAAGPAGLAFVGSTSAVGAAFYGVTSIINGGADLEVEVFKGAVAGAQFGVTLLSVYQTSLSFRCGQPLGLFGCFAAGTPILTNEGSKAVEDILPGDWVMAARDDDPEAGPVLRAVEEIFENYMPTLDLHVNGRAIRTTAEHPFWVRGRGWVHAQQLETGDQLRSGDGRWLNVENIDGPKASVPVYNICVAEYHTYFIGHQTWGFSVWSHNASPNCSAITTSRGGVGLTPAQIRARNASAGIPAGRLGGSGLPRIISRSFPTRKIAKDAARQRGGSSPINDGGGQTPHFHPVDHSGGKLSPSEHFNYPYSQS